eukprot:gene890-9801_t
MKTQVSKKRKKEEEEIKKLNRHQTSRLLYTNPVCILTSFHEDKKNMMTITWLTPINNTGNFICSMKKSRYTTVLVLKQKEFVLNVPTKSLGSTVLKIGKETGENTDKFKLFEENITICGLGWEKYEEKSPFAISECVAQMFCSINKIMDDLDKEHYIFHCSIDKAFVKSNYWKDNRFCPQNKEDEPYMTFFGGQEFGYVHKEE